MEMRMTMVKESERKKGRGSRGKTGEGGAAAEQTAHRTKEAKKGTDNWKIGKKTVDHNRRGASVGGSRPHQDGTQATEQLLHRLREPAFTSGTPAWRCLPMRMA